jgi:hypothetical protein
LSFFFCWRRNLSLGQSDVNNHVDSPAIDPYVFAVGGADSTTGVDEELQPVTSRSSRGDGDRNPETALDFGEAAIGSGAIDMGLSPPRPNQSRRVLGSMPGTCSRSAVSE